MRRTPEVVITKIDQEEEVKEVAITEAVEEVSEVETKEVAEMAKKDTMINHQLEKKEGKKTEEVIDKEAREDIMITTMITEELTEVMMIKDPHVAEVVQEA